MKCTQIPYHLDCVEMMADQLKTIWLMIPINKISSNYSGSFVRCFC